MTFLLPMLKSTLDEIIALISTPKFEALFGINSQCEMNKLTTLAGFETYQNFCCILDPASGCNVTALPVVIRGCGVAVSNVQVGVNFNDSYSLFYQN